jgi:hypothetical protein
MVIIRTILIVALLSISVSASYGVDIAGFNCGQSKNDIPQLEAEFIDKNFVVSWYKAPVNSIHFGNVKPLTASYLFLGKKFYGTTYSIVGKEDIISTLRYLDDRLKIIYKDEIETNPLSHPLRTGHYWIFIHPQKVYFLKRYSVHVATLEILCRDMWEKNEYVNLAEMK